MDYVSRTFTVKIPLVGVPKRVKLWLTDDVGTGVRWTMRTLRERIPRDIARDICGVQPMSGPSALIHTMRVRYASPIEIALWLR